jgi:hypothetical protein
MTFDRPINSPSRLRTSIGIRRRRLLHRHNLRSLRNRYALLVAASHRSVRCR